MTSGGSAFGGATETLTTWKSWITTKEMTMASRRLDSIHPGEILEEEFMRPFGLSANALAKRIDVPVTRISEIVRGDRGVTPDTALRLARLFNTSSELWLGLQAEYDLRVARMDLASELEKRIIPLKHPSSTARVVLPTRSLLRERSDPYRVPRGRHQKRDRRRTRRG